MECPRCSGYLIWSKSERSCLQCGWAGFTRTPADEYGPTGARKTGGRPLSQNRKPILPGEH